MWQLTSRLKFNLPSCNSRTTGWLSRIEPSLVEFVFCPSCVTLPSHIRVLCLFCLHHMFMGPGVEPLALFQVGLVLWACWATNRRCCCPVKEWNQHYYFRMLITKTETATPTRAGPRIQHHHVWGGPQFNQCTGWGWGTVQGGKKASGELGEKRTQTCQAGHWLKMFYESIFKCCYHVCLSLT